MGRPPKDKGAVKQCMGVCGRTRALTMFYNTNSKFFPDGKLNICKDCLKEMVDVNDINSVLDMLRTIDKPFIDFLWEKAKESNNHTMGEYLKLVNSLPQYRDLGWNDGAKVSKAQPQVESPKPQSHPQSDDGEIPVEWIIKWGEWESKNDYLYLEDLYDRMKLSYRIETASHEDYLINICMVSLMMKKAIRAGDIDAHKKLSDTYDKLNKSAKFTAVQRTSADAAGGLNSFSEWFQRLEQENGFIPKFHHDEPMDIVDATLEDLKRWTKQTIMGDPNIPRIVEESIARMNSGQDVEEDAEDSEYDEVYFLDDEEDDEGDEE